MANFLFENDYKCWTLDELSNADFELFKATNTLIDDYNVAIEDFYGKLYNGQHNIPFYHCLPTLNSVVGEKKFKFVAVTIGDDEIFFAYKVIQILKTRQIRVFDTPISRNGNNDNIENVIKSLSCKPFVRFCFTTNHLPFYESVVCGHAQRLVEYDNYYYINDMAKDITNRQKKNFGIRLLDENENFKVALNEKIKLCDLQGIRNDFSKYLKERGSTVNKKDDEEFYNICVSKSDNIKIITIRYNGVLIHINVLYVVRKLNIAYSLYDISKHEYDRQDSILKKAIEHNMTEKIKYYTSLLLPMVKFVYILGCRPSEHRLLAHKERISDGKVEYFIL